MKNTIHYEYVVAGYCVLDPTLSGEVDVSLLSDKLCVELVTFVRQLHARGLKNKHEVIVEIAHKFDEEQQDRIEHMIDSTHGEPSFRHALRRLEIIRACQRASVELRKRADAIDTAEDIEDAEAQLQIAAAKLVEMENDLSEEIYPAITYQTLLEYEPRIEHDSILGDGWIKRGNMTLLTGETGMGKSVFVTQLALFVAAGKDFFGMKCRRRYRVLMLEAENDMDILKRDVTSIAEHFCLQPDDLTSFCCRWAHSLSGKAFFDQLSRWMSKHMPDLLIIDNYQSYFGGRDINSATEWHEWFRPVITECKKYQSALLLVDHTPKPKNITSQDQKSNPRLGVYSAAGTSAKSNSARAAAEICSLPDEEDRFMLRFSKNAERTGLRTETNPPRVVRKLYIEHSGNPHKPFWILSLNQEEEPTELQQRIQEALADNVGLSAAKLAEIVGCDRSTIYRYAKKKGISIR